MKAARDQGDGDVLTTAVTRRSDTWSTSVQFFIARHGKPGAGCCDDDNRDE